MAASGYTPILIYASGTATNLPLAANLTSSASGAELALNYADGKLYYKNSSGVVTLLASSTTVTNSFSAGMLPSCSKIIAPGCSPRFTRATILSGLAMTVSRLRIVQPMTCRFKLRAARKVPGFDKPTGGRKYFGETPEAFSTTA